MGLFWRSVIFCIIFLIVSDIKVSASLYKMEDNWITVKFPQWMEQPMIEFETGPRQKTVFIFTNPFDKEEEKIKKEDY